MYIYKFERDEQDGLSVDVHTFEKCRLPCPASTMQSYEANHTVLIIKYIAGWSEMARVCFFQICTHPLCVAEICVQVPTFQQLFINFFFNVSGSLWFGFEIGSDCLVVKVGLWWMIIHALVFEQFITVILMESWKHSLGTIFNPSFVLPWCWYCNALFLHYYASF